MSQTVADVLVGVLEQIGVKQIFGLIGDSLNPLAASRDHAPVLALSGDMPRKPHVDLDMIGHVAAAKIKEAVLAVTGE
jgi:thiamine pyrophosphate-dependent acetolactate synthase large subunit-like protein